MGIVMNLQPLLFIRLLADRQLNPCAASIHFADGDMQALPPLFATTAFSEFSKGFPCVIEHNAAKHFPDNLITAVLNTPCQILEEQDQPYQSDEQTKPTIPPAAHWISGNWCLAPPAKLSATQTSSRALSLKLLHLVATDADTCEIETIFRGDPVLAYHLLRLVNSIGVGVGRHVSSFSQAILILGRQQLKRWLNLMLFAANRDDYRSPMLLARATVRARSLELLAKAKGLDRTAQEQAFMAGMFSLLGTLFGIPLQDILKPLKLHDTITRAVLHYENELGALLKTIEKFEESDSTGLNASLALLGLSTNDFNALILEAYHWMTNIIHEKRDSTRV